MFQVLLKGWLSNDTRLLWTISNIFFGGGGVKISIQYIQLLWIKYFNYKYINSQERKQDFLSPDTADLRSRQDTDTEIHWLHPDTGHRLGRDC